MSIYERQDYSSLMSTSNIQVLEKEYKCFEDAMENSIEGYKTKVKKFHVMIKDAKRDMRDFLNKNNLHDLKPPVLSENIEDDLIPNGIGSYLNYRDPSDLRFKNFTESTYDTFKRVVMEQSAPIQTYLSLLEDRIRYLSNLKQKYEEEIRKKTNLLAGYNERKKKNYKDYVDIKNKINGLSFLITACNELKDLFDDVPSDFTTDDAVKMQDVSMDRFCHFYKVRYRNFKENLIDYGENFPEDVGDINSIGGILRSGNFRDQYLDTVDNKDTVLVSLDRVISILILMKDKAIAAADEIAGKPGIKNPVLENLMKKVTNILSSKVQESNTDQKTLDNLKSENDVYLNKAVESVNSTKKVIQQAGDNLALLSTKVSKDLLIKMASVFGFGKKNEKTPKGNLEDFWREKVRKKYGGAVPFCDEFESIDPQGNKSYIKKEEAVLVSAGYYQKKTEKKSDDYMNNQGSKPEDIYK